MTENEAIKVIKILNFCGLCTTGPCGECERKQAKEGALSALEEIQQYRAIGTVEEFREGRERQIPKKPMRIRLLETSWVHCGICPICKNPVYADLSNKNHREYCGHCGQAIDWR